MIHHLQKKQMTLHDGSASNLADSAIVALLGPVGNPSAKPDRKQKTNAATYIRQLAETGKLSGAELARMGIHFSH